MASYARCAKCQEIVRFHLDKLGRVYEICPVCDEGRPPSLSRELKAAIERMKRSDVRYCVFDECGKDFVPTSNSQQYCSEACCRAMYRKQGGAALQAYREGLARRKCDYDQCREWYKPQSEVQVYCSSTCRYDHQKQQARLERERKRILENLAKKQQEQAA